MSSHHFVKEKQEPAVLIYAEDDLPEEMLGDLLEWSPVVCVHENALSSVNHLEIKIDIIFRKEMDAEVMDVLTGGQQAITVIQLETDDPAWEMIRYLSSTKHAAVNILGYSLPSIERCAAMSNEIDLIFFSGNSKLYPLKKIFKKWKTKGERMKLLTHDGLSIILLKNLQQVSSNELEVMNDGLIELHIEGEHILLSEPL